MSAPQRHIGVLGVPTSAGTHFPGQEKAPAALRAAGLVQLLRDAGVTVTDHGDLPEQRFSAAQRVDGVRDLARVVQVARAVADRVAAIRAAGQVPLVLGGDCTITLGVVAGAARADDVGLLYLDGDADLGLPESSDSGVLDTMGVTHLLGGGAPALAGISGAPPLLEPDRIVLFGFDPGELDTEQWERAVRMQLHVVPCTAVRQEPTRAAEEAMVYLAERTDTIVVHLDVDAMDSGTFPLANFPHFNGLSLDEVGTAVRRACSDTRLAALVVTEVNPDHDPDGIFLRRLVERLVQALRCGESAHHQRPAARTDRPHRPGADAQRPGADAP